ncbi:hypothetical protein MRB53_019248 [Persea americana]|uniref:Uncharacterized protein n=1 Tax=Persea americana TaxID=3435 RepID=A0ACC2KYH6_PERAE|nr:hypothetical protein MRB53_019248 [Persea americana]
MQSSVSLLEEADKNLVAELHTTGTTAKPVHSWCCQRAGTDAKLGELALLSSLQMASAVTDLVAQLAELVPLSRCRVESWCYGNERKDFQTTLDAVICRLREEVDRNTGLVSLLRSWFRCRAAGLLLLPSC